MKKNESSQSRRNFLKTTGVLAAGTVMAGGFSPKVHAAGSDQIRIATIGCGSRGRGATIQALNADPNVVLWAVSDSFEDKTRNSAAAVKAEMEKQEQPQKYGVDDRLFIGLDGYKAAMDSLRPGDAVVLATPPVFRPLHFAYAVEKGLNVFAEKPVAVDIPGLKWLQETNKKAIEKNLKVAVGLNNRHYLRTEETIKEIHNGRLGDIMSCWVYRMQNIHAISDMPEGMNPMEFQLRHIFNFNWTTGGFIVDALIHNLDICCWAMQKLPVAVQGQGGRVVRTAKDQLLDHSAVEYRFDDGRRLMMFAQLIPNAYMTFESVIHGTKGSMVVGEGVGEPRMFADWNAQRQRRGEAVWKASSPSNDSYQTEHDKFFKAIRDNQTWNEMQRGIDATFTPIFGRMAVESGQLVTAEQAWNSTFEYVPNIADLTFEGPLPLVPDENGHYPQAVPGVTKI